MTNEIKLQLFSADYLGDRSKTSGVVAGESSSERGPMEQVKIVHQRPRAGVLHPPLHRLLADRGEQPEEPSAETRLNYLVKPVSLDRGLVNWEEDIEDEIFGLRRK
jgi:hypothetical protein